MHQLEDGARGGEILISFPSPPTFMNIACKFVILRAGSFFFPAKFTNEIKVTHTELPYGSKTVAKTFKFLLSNLPEKLTYCLKRTFPMGKSRKEIRSQLIGRTVPEGRVVPERFTRLLRRRF